MNYQEKKYSMSVILDALKTLLTTRQKEGESLQDFTKRFWVTREVLESHLGGPIILTKILQANSGYTEEPTDEVEKEKNKILEDQAFEQLQHTCTWRMPIKPSMEVFYQVSVLSSCWGMTNIQKRSLKPTMC